MANGAGLSPARLAPGTLGVGCSPAGNRAMHYSCGSFFFSVFKSTEAGPPLDAPSTDRDGATAVQLVSSRRVERRGSRPDP